MLKEGTMARGIFDPDKKVVEKSIRELKARLKKPIMSNNYSKVLSPYIFDDSLFDLIDGTYNDLNVGNKDITKNPAIMDEINMLISAAEKGLVNESRKLRLEATLNESKISTKHLEDKFEANKEKNFFEIGVSLGQQAFRKGIENNFQTKVPAQDKQMETLIQDISRNYPKEKSKYILAALKGWNKGYHRENLKQPVKIDENRKLRLRATFK